MKVVFVQEVEGTGRVGEVKEVKNGYARNYLLPRGLAVPATRESLARAEKLAEADAIRQGKLDGAASRVRDKIDGAGLTFQARVGSQGRLFGSITASDIAGKLGEIAGETIDHRQVLLGQSIRSLGVQDVRVRLTRNVSAQVSVEVQADEGEGQLTIQEAVEAVEQSEAEDAATAAQATETEPSAEAADAEDTT